MNSINVKEFTLYSDSMYLIGTVTKGWQRRKNTDLWIELDNLILKDIKIIWTHVKGHSGNKWNNYCDMLCVHATKLIDI